MVEEMNYEDELKNIERKRIQEIVASDKAKCCNCESEGDLIELDYKGSDEWICKECKK